MIFASICYSITRVPTLPWKGLLADGTTRRENRNWIQFGSMVADDATPARLRRFTRGQQILLTTIENESEPLMCDSQHSSCTCDAAVRCLQRMPDQFALVAKYLCFERSVHWKSWWLSLFGRQLRIARSSSIRSRGIPVDLLGVGERLG